MTTRAMTVQEQQVLEAYEDDPMPDGDALLVLDERVCLELAGMADGWDDDGAGVLASLLTETTSQSVRLVIARRGAELRAGDFRIWRDLHAALRDSGIELRTLRALPAA